MRLDGPTDLFREMVREAYSAEAQLTLALPRVALRATDPQLRRAIEGHLTETREQLQRLTRIGDELAFSPGGRTCKGMMGLLQEGDENMGFGGRPALIDSMIVACSQRIEAYEQAMYRAMLRLAPATGAKADVLMELLETSLREEEAAEVKLAAFIDGAAVGADR